MGGGVASVAVEKREGDDLMTRMETLRKSCEEMDSKKIEWLSSIGAVAFEEPVKFSYGFEGYHGAFNLSEAYVENTPLERLKAQYDENKNYVLRLISDETRKDNFQQNAERPRGIPAPLSASASP